MSEVNELFGNEKTNESPSFSKEDWVNKKIEDRSKAYEMLETATVELSSPEKLAQYLDVQSRFNRYSVSNALLVAFQKPEATRLGDAAFWNNQGAFIQKGEKAVTILEPEEYTKKTGEKGISYVAKKLFDISQTNAKPKHYKNRSVSDKALVTALCKTIRCDIDISNNLPADVKAQYVPADDKIYIRQGMEGPEIFRSLAQEAAKAIFEKSDMSPDVKSVSAVCVTYILCKRNNIETPDLKSSEKAFEGKDAKDIRAALSKVRDEANNISASIEKTLDAKKRDAR